MGIEHSKNYVSLYKSKSLGNIDQYDSSNLFKHFHPKNTLNNNWINQLFLPIFAFKTSPNEKDFKILEKIGNGAFGKVYKVIKKDENKLYAMKILKKSMILACDAVEQCKDEAYIQFMLGNNHPFILEALFIWQNNINLYIISEYLENGELHSLWVRFKKLCQPLIRIYIIEITSALAYLHEAGIIYRDLKLENLLLDSKGHIRLTDFGLSKWLAIGERTRTICGTLVYMAPEIANEELYGHGCDWWSLGILIFAMLFGTFPVYGANDHVELRAKMHKFPYDRLPFSYHMANIDSSRNYIINNTAQHSSKYNKDKLYSNILFAAHANAIDLIHKLLKTNPDERLSESTELLLHPFTSDLPAPFNNDSFDNKNDNYKESSRTKSFFDINVLTHWKDIPLWDLYFYKENYNDEMLRSPSTPLLPYGKFTEDSSSNNNIQRKNLPMLPTIAEYDDYIIKRTNGSGFTTLISDSNINNNGTDHKIDHYYESAPITANEGSGEEPLYLQKNIKYKSIALPPLTSSYTLEDNTLVSVPSLKHNKKDHLSQLTSQPPHPLYVNHRQQQLNIYQNFYELNADESLDNLEDSSRSTISPQDSTFSEFEYVSKDVYI